MDTDEHGCPRSAGFSPFQLPFAPGVRALKRTEVRAPLAEVRVFRPTRNRLTLVRAQTEKISGRAPASSPRDEGVGRGLRRGVASLIEARVSSSPRPSPPSDGGEGVAAASPRFVHPHQSVVNQ